MAKIKKLVEVDDEFPEDTAPWIDANGYPRIGHVTDNRDDNDGTALYYFPGDFIAGDGFEAWLDPITASDPILLADYLRCDDKDKEED